jgi:cell division protein ZapA
MPHLSVTINGRSYSIACEEGQQEHLGRLADYFKLRVDELVESLGQIGDARLMLMAGLMISDELYDSGAELAVARGTADEVAATTQIEQNRADRMVANLEKLAERVETIAARLEAP